MSATARKLNAGNLEDALKKALHHLTTNKIFYWLAEGGEEEILNCSVADLLDYRGGIIGHEIAEALARIKRVRQLAEERGYADVLAILNEEFSFGHDITD